MVLTVGEVEIKTRLAETEIKWKIPEFWSVFEADNFKSPDFRFGTVSWHLEIYSYFDDYYSGDEYMHLYLCTDILREYSVEYNFGLTKRDGSVEQLLKGILKGNNTRNLAKEAFFFTKRKIRQWELELVPSDILTISGILKFETVSSIQPSPVLDKRKLENLIIVEANIVQHYMTIGVGAPAAPVAFVSFYSCKQTDLDALSENLRRIFVNKDNCDTTLHVADKEYKAHRAILIAGSSVFAAMFQHETSEKATGIVTIPDCDPESFEKFLEFLYTGKLEKPSPRNALHLYETSEKYNVQELKAFCAEYLMQNLTVEILCDVVVLADTYDEENLLSVAQSFFNENCSEILDTSEWDSLVKNNYRLSKKLLKEMCRKGN